LMLGKEIFSNETAAELRSQKHNGTLLRYLHGFSHPLDDPSVSAILFLTV
jgi:hypothetical protein